MNSTIFNQIKNEYEKRRQEAFNSQSDRINEIYSLIPSIEEIDHKIKLAGIRHTKMILSGTSSSDDSSTALSKEIENLTSTKLDMLVGKGYPKNYLEIFYKCSLCKDTGYIEVEEGYEKCICLKQEIINYLFRQSNIKNNSDNFESFDESYYPDTVDIKRYGINISPRENILNIKEKCLGFIDNFGIPDEKNLFFTGPTGVGKTFMANCISLEVLNKGKTVLYQTANKLFEIINEHKQKKHKDEDYNDLNYNNIMEAELLVIDDMGTESPSASRYAELLNILNTRQSNNLKAPCKTIISTNISAKKLHEYYDERIISRIIGGFSMLLFVGEDIRRIKKSEN